MPTKRTTGLLRGRTERSPPSGNRLGGSLAAGPGFFLGGLRILHADLAINGRKDAALDHLGFGLKPVLQRKAFHLAAGVVKLAGAAADVPFHHACHKFLLLLPASCEFHCWGPRSKMSAYKSISMITDWG